MKMRAELLQADALAFEELFDLRFTDNDLNRRTLISDMNDLVLVVAGKGGVSRAELETRVANKQRALANSEYKDIGKEGRFSARVILMKAMDLLSGLE